jgi:hypothetical protein
MKIYALAPLYDQYKSFLAKDNDIAAERYESLRCKGKPINWPAPLTIVGDEEDVGIPEADIGFINIGSIVLAETSYALLKNVVAQYGQLLPLNLDGRSLWLWNVTNIVDALDSKKSEFNSYGGVVSPIFSGEKIGQSIAFKIKEDNFTNIYCTDQFVKLVKQNELTGLDFDEFDVV